jgi:hypothetical protein
MDGNPPSPIEFHHAADRGDGAAGAVANSLELEVAALNNRPFPSLRSLLCLAQRSFPLFVGVVPNAALRKDRVGDFELSIHFAIEAGCVPSTIKLLRNGFADWAKEGHFEAHLLGPFALARSARVIRQSTKSIKAPRFELGVVLMGKMVSMPPSASRLKPTANLFFPFIA